MGEVEIKMDNKILTIAKCPEGGEEWFLGQYKLVADSTRKKATELNVYVNCPIHTFNLKKARKSGLFPSELINTILIQAQIAIDKQRGVLP